MSSDTRKIVWRRQFNQLKKENPELVEEKGDRMTVKYPVPGHIIHNYRTLTSYNLFTSTSSSGVGDGVLKQNTQVVTKQPKGFKVGPEGLKNRDQVLNALQIWSFCNTFKHYMGLYRVPKDLDSFYNPEVRLSDELVFKLLTHCRQYPENDLLTYLVNRTEDDFFQLSDWPIVARLLGTVDTEQKDKVNELLVEVIFEIQNTENFRSYLSAQLENCCRDKQELLRQKEALDQKFANDLQAMDKKLAQSVDEMQGTSRSTRRAQSKHSDAVEKLNELKQAAQDNHTAEQL